MPVTMPLIEYYENGNAGRFSPYIIPCYLGLTFPNNSLSQLEILHYKKYEPIGCRNEKTLNVLRKYQINPYLHGCITQLLPKRRINKEQNKIIIVDVEKNVLEKIPEKIKRKAVFKSHFYSNISDPKSICNEQYNYYKNNAKLVITSLLHCAVPCVAAGIPVIMIRNKVTYRMAWLEKIIPIYTIDNISDINWEPDLIDYDKHKNTLFQFTIERLRETFNCFSKIMDISYFYETRNKSIYVNDACESLKSFIDNNWLDKEKEYKYGIWGMTLMSKWLYEYISDKYPNAILCHIYDSYRNVSFNGIQSVSPENISYNMDEVVFVTTENAIYDAEILFNNINKEKNTYAFVKFKR